MVLPRHLARALRVAAFALPALSAFFAAPSDILLAGKKGGGAKVPQKKELPDEESERAKQRAADEKNKIERKRKGASIATSPQGVLGAAPTSRPDLKGSLGG